MAHKRMKPADRKREILDAALSVAGTLGFSKFRLVDVAERAQCSTGLVMLYWPTMTKLRRAVMRAAIKREVLNVIAVGIALEDSSCRDIPADLRERALRTL